VECADAVADADACIWQWHRFPPTTPTDEDDDEDGGAEDDDSGEAGVDDRAGACIMMAV